VLLDVFSDECDCSVVGFGGDDEFGSEFDGLAIGDEEFEGLGADVVVGELPAWGRVEVVLFEGGAESIAGGLETGREGGAVRVPSDNACVAAESFGG
jgi:hypothetical protein